MDQDPRLRNDEDVRVLIWADARRESCKDQKNTVAQKHLMLARETRRILCGG